MPKMELVDDPTSELSAERIREQLELLVQDHVFRSSKRSVEFLRYVVDQTLNGAADQIKERSIGIGVFGREPSYDTNLDHVVRTAAIELRKRLAIYYGDERHRSELRIALVPGSYIPRFTLPAQTASEPAELEIAPGAANVPMRARDADAGFEAAAPEIAGATLPVRKPRAGLRPYLSASFAAVAAFCILAYFWPRPRNAEDLFWAPILETSGPVLVAVGEAANGPPTASAAPQDTSPSLPVLH
ncbi:MAG TPA: hypothetical protein VGR96_08865, partial [Acidobacteriaceae bacterium]|nr:hypothetical protein [Acidobacteriaceae bacterium]